MLFNMSRNLFIKDILCFIYKDVEMAEIAYNSYLLYLNENNCENNVKSNKLKYIYTKLKNYSKNKSI